MSDRYRARSNVQTRATRANWIQILFEDRIGPLDRANRSLGNRGLRRVAVGSVLPIAYLAFRFLERASGPIGLVSTAAVIPLALLQAEFIRANREAGISVFHHPGLSRWEVMFLLLLAPLTLFAVFEALGLDVFDF